MTKQSTASEQLLLLENIDELKQQLITVLEQAKQQVFIFSRTLNPLLFNNNEVENAISAAARANRNSYIHIVVQQPQSIVEADHRLLKLARRLPSKIVIKNLIIDPPVPYEFTIVDDNKLWLQHEEGIYTGFVNTDARLEVKRFNDQVNHLWKHSEEDVRLRKLLL